MSLSFNLPKIKMSPRVIAVGIALVGFLFYFWVSGTKVPEIETQTARLNSTNSQLEVTENQLATLYNSMEHYLEETERYLDETEEVLTQFPTYMYLEDKILYADTLLKTDFAGYNMTDFAYGDNRYVMNVSYGVDDNKMLELYSVSLSTKYMEMSYNDLKTVMNYGLTSSQRFVINSVTAFYEEGTGLLSGEISFTTYFIPGQTTPYEFPQYVIDGLGNSDRIDDLFGTIS